MALAINPKLTYRALYFREAKEWVIVSHDAALKLFKEYFVTPTFTGAILEETHGVLGAIGKEFHTVMLGQPEKLVGLTYEPLFPYFADTKNAFKVIDGGEAVTEGEGTGVIHMAPGFGEIDQKILSLIHI